MVASLAFTHNVFATVWLGIGLLYYPSKLLFWKPVHDALAMTVVYIVLMGCFLQPLLRRKLRARREYRNRFVQVSVMERASIWRKIMSRPN